MDNDALDAKVERGIALLTTYLTRGSDGTMDEGLGRSILGNNVSDDDAIAALSDMVGAVRLTVDPTLALVSCRSG